MNSNHVGSVSPTKQQNGKKDAADLDRLLFADAAASHGGSVLGQFAACITKNVHQKRRAPCNCCLELLLPVVFIAGIVGLWAVIDRETYADEQYIATINVGNRSNTTTQLGDDGTTTMSSFYNHTLNFHKLACFNASASSGIDGLSPCPVGAVNRQLFCHNHPRIPVEGFCTLLHPIAIVTAFDSALRTAPFGPLPLDVLVMLQWTMHGTGLDPPGAGVGGEIMVLRSLLNSGMLHFAPDTPAVHSIRAHLNDTTNLFKYVAGHVFPDESSAVLWTELLETEGQTWAVVVVEAFDADSLSLTIRCNRTSVQWTTDNVVSEVWSGGMPPNPRHKAAFSSGFATIQHHLLGFYTAAVHNEPPPPEPVFAAMPTAAYTGQVFLNIAGDLMPFMVVLSFLYPVSQITKRLVQEKETRVREVMMIMGLSKAPFYMSWLFTYTLQIFFSAFFSTLLLKITVFAKSDVIITFLLFFLFGVSCVCLSMLMASFFSKARIAAILSPIIFFVLSGFNALIEDAPRGTLLGLSFMSPSTFTIGLQLLIVHEQGSGLTNEKFNHHRDRFTMLEVFVMLAVDSIIYFLMALYFDAVVPSQYGTSANPLFFILQPARWLWRKVRSSSTEAAATDEEELDRLPDGRDQNGVYEEDEDEKGQKKSSAQVRVRGLRKSFTRDGEPFAAVNNLHLNLREGQVFVLLGHNGAGKTTAMNLMTGMTEIDQGDCIVYGKSVRNDIHGVRQEIGCCPQHNVLWPELTCIEHLRFFAAMKGLRGADRERAAVGMLRAVDLLEKENAPAGVLSGGQKRKLSVAIAFVGNSRLVFLDEPTAGMDVVARRHTWDMIKQLSKGRTILLTTHFMDEADLLGHQIAIMSKGSLKCQGSPMFLKSRLGVGYSITMSVDPRIDANATVSPKVRQYIPDAQTLMCGAGEAAYRLPMSSVAKFPGLLRLLEEEGSSMGVGSWTISVTTLEEIFLRIAQIEDMNEAMPALNERQTSSSMILPMPSSSAAVQQRQDETTVFGGGDSPATTVRSNTESRHEEASRHVWNVNKVPNNGSDSGLARMQFKAMLKKRFNNSRRDKRTVCLQIIAPVLCVLIAMLLELYGPPALHDTMMDPSIYGATTEAVLVNCDGILGELHPMVAEHRFASSDQMLANVPAAFNDSVGTSDYLLRTFKEHHFERFDSFHCADPFASAAVGFNTSVIFHNQTARHQVYVSLATYHRAYLQQRAPAGKWANVGGYVVYNDPLPWTSRQEAFISTIRAVMIGIVILVPFTFIPSTFVSWIVKEKETKARHLQNVSGLRFFVYWFSNLVFDVSSCLVTTALVICVFFAFSREEYVGSAEALVATILLLFFYSLSGIAIAYLLSFLFEEHSTAQNVVMLTNFVTGFLLVLIVFIMMMIETTKGVAESMQWGCRLVPAYCLGEGMIQLAMAHVATSFGGAERPLDMEVTGYAILYMAIEFPVFFFLTLLVDHPDRRMRQQQLLHDTTKEAEPIADEDEDVLKERQEVEGNLRANDLVVVNRLHKRYANGKVAVKNVSFGVHPGEVFGLLGTNGAGKTTTIAALCQEFLPTHGRAFIAGHDVVQDSEAALHNIGYCPQFDALIDLLTTKEHLELYSAVRGVAETDRAKVVDALLTICELQVYKNALASKLSGGNKRKLSVALALIGGPRVVFLDEPSAGMDPVARRGLWKAIEAIASNCAVVLTTHHLEEVEALAHRVAIMVDGTLRCIGDKTHLKRKYGSGFEMSIRVARPEDAEGLRNFVKSSIPDATVNEERSQKIIYALPANTRLSETFSLLERHKRALGITDYAVQQTSIEQVFLRISEEAEEEKEAEVDDEPGAAVQQSASSSQPLPLRDSTTVRAPPTDASDGSRIGNPILDVPVQRFSAVTPAAASSYYMGGFLMGSSSAQGVWKHPMVSDDDEL